MDFHGLTTFLSTIPSPWNYMLASALVLLLMVPRLMEAWRAVTGAGRDRRELARKRETLEVLKLQFEVEALKREVGLPKSDSVPPSPLPELREAPPAEEPAEEPHLKPPKPEDEDVPVGSMSVGGRIIVLLLAIAQGIVGFFGFSVAIQIVLMPYFAISGRDGDMGEVVGDGDISAVVGWVMALAMTWGLYKGFMGLRRVRARIKRRYAGQAQPEPDQVGPEPEQAGPKPD